MRLPLTDKILSRRKRGKPEVTSGKIREKERYEAYIHASLDLNIRNESDRSFNIVTAEVRELNGRKVVQKGSVDSLMVDSKDYADIEPEFMFEDAELLSDSNSVLVKLRVEDNGELHTHVYSLEGLELS